MYTELPRPNTRDAHLSEANVETIKATLPLVGANIDKITPLFYKTMFSNHPELIADLFNRGNQRSGDQQKALAASIVTFASMLVDPMAPNPADMLARIGHKHVSLGITADQYQIVHDNLFSAIVEVLGADTVTAEVAEAWDEVYWLMAKTLIDFEHSLYQDIGVGDGDVFRNVTVTEKKQLSDTVYELTFAGQGFENARPGQYVSIGVKLSDGARQLRQYSLVNWNADGFTVAVQQSGEVSTHLIERVKIGDTVDATLPAGDLTLSISDAPLVLVSQGIGSTPMTGMLRSLVANGRESDVTVLHADADAQSYAQKDITEASIRELAERGSAKHIIRYRGDGETIDLQELVGDSVIPRGAQWYLCGGTHFLQDIRNQLEACQDALTPAEIHFELFSPNDWLV